MYLLLFLKLFMFVSFLFFIFWDFLMYNFRIPYPAPGVRTGGLFPGVTLSWWPPLDLFELHLGQGILEKKTCKLPTIFMVFWTLVFFLNLLTAIFQSSKTTPPSLIISNYCRHNSGGDKGSVVTPHNRTETSTIEFCNIVCSFLTF